jgi:hypothetical protein
MATRYPILDTQLTTPTTAGRTLLTAANAAAQRTALGTAAGSSEPVPFPGSWTVGNGSLAGASASAASGQLVVSLPAAGSQSFSAGTDFAGAWQEVTPVNGSFAVIARLAQISSNGNLFGRFVMRRSSSISVSQYGFQVQGNFGTAVPYVYSSGGGATSYGSAVLATNGTGWLRIEQIGTSIRFWSGTGTTSAPPTSWTLVGSVAISTADDWSSRVAFAGAWPNSALGSPGTVTWSNVAVTTP